MSDYAMFSPPLFADLGWALIHLLWQGVLVAVALEIALMLAGKRNARVRYFLCAVALVAMPVCFAVTFAQKTHEVLSPAERMAATEDAGMVSATPLLSSGISAPVSQQLGTEDLVLHALPSWDWNRAMPFVASAWLAGVILLCGRKAGGFYLLWRWRRRGLAEPDGAMREMFERACRNIGIDPRRICLKISELVRVPMTMGWWRPIVLFPACLLSGLGADEIELLLAHELAHIRRWDYLANLLQGVVETLFFYHPLTWWISRRLRQERENCCDDLVARSSGKPLVYAKALLRLETMRSPGAELVAAASGGVLRQRIERLLGDPTPGMAGGFSLLLILLFFVSAVAFSYARAQVPVIPPMAATVVVTETKDFVSDVGRLYHAIVYKQTSAAAPQMSPNSWQIIADMSNNTFPVNGGTVSLPAGSTWPTNPVTVVRPDQLVGAHYLYVQGFKSEEDLMANFPNGKYTFNIQPGASAGAPYSAPISFTGSVPYPPIAPVITNKTWDSGALILDPNSAIINFTNYPGATLTWEIVIPGDHYIMSTGEGERRVGSLNLTGMLSYGQTYVAQLRFVNRDKSSTVSDPAYPKDYGYSTMMARIVEFTIKTPAEHASAAPDPTASGIAAIVNGHAITSVELKQRWKSSEDNLRANLSGDELKTKLAEMQKKVLNALIDRWLIIDDFKKQGGFIPRSFIDERINDVVTQEYGGDRAAFLNTLADRRVTLESYCSEIENNAIVVYMRNRFVEDKVWDYYASHLNLFPADELLRVTSMEIKGLVPMPAGHAADFAAETDPRAVMARDALRKIQAGADVSTLPRTEGVDPKDVGQSMWVTRDRFPGRWPITWDQVEKLKVGETTGIVVGDGSYSDQKGPSQNYHYYYIVRLDESRPAKVVATAKTMREESALLNAERERVQDAWLASLRAKAQIQILADPKLTMDSWATEAPRAVPVSARVPVY